MQTYCQSILYCSRCIAKEEDMIIKVKGSLLVATHCYSCETRYFLNPLDGLVTDNVQHVVDIEDLTA